MAACLSAMLTALAFLTACGDSDEVNAGGETASPSPTKSSHSPTPTKKSRNVIAWILGLGPSAPQGPPEFAAYRELQNLDCADVSARLDALDEPDTTLYRGAAQACLAAFEGQEELWPAAEEARDFVAARRADLTCMGRAAFALLERMVALHVEHPDRPFQKAPAGKSKSPPCPSITTITPEPASQGDVVRITGRHLAGNVVGISLINSNGGSQGGGQLTAVDGGLEFTLPEEPPSDASATVCVVVRAEPEWDADGKLFTYEATNSGPPTEFECPPRPSG